MMYNIRPVNGAARENNTAIPITEQTRGPKVSSLKSTQISKRQQQMHCGSKCMVEEIRISSLSYFLEAVCKYSHTKRHFYFLFFAMIAITACAACVGPL